MAVLSIGDATLAGHHYRGVKVRRDGVYSNGAPAIELTCVDDVYEEPLATATVNLPNDMPAAGCVWIRNSEENEGMLQLLVDAGVVEPTGRTTTSGWITVFEARLTGAI